MVMPLGLMPVLLLSQCVVSERWTAQLQLPTLVLLQFEAGGHCVSDGLDHLHWQVFTMASIFSSICADQDRSELVQVALVLWSLLAPCQHPNLAHFRLLTQSLVRDRTQARIAILCFIQSNLTSVVVEVSLIHCGHVVVVSGVGVRRAQVWRSNGPESGFSVR